MQFFGIIKKAVAKATEAIKSIVSSASLASPAEGTPLLPRFVIATAAQAPEEADKTMVKKTAEKIAQIFEKLVADFIFLFTFVTTLVTASTSGPLLPVHALPTQVSMKEPEHNLNLLTGIPIIYSPSSPDTEEMIHSSLGYISSPSSTNGMIHSSFGSSTSSSASSAIVNNSSSGISASLASIDFTSTITSIGTDTDSVISYAADKCDDSGYVTAEETVEDQTDAVITTLTTTYDTCAVSSDSESESDDGSDDSSDENTISSTCSIYPHPPAGPKVREIQYPYAYLYDTKEYDRQWQIYWLATGEMAPLWRCHWELHTRPDPLDTNKGPELTVTTPEGVTYYPVDPRYYAGGSSWADMDDEDDEW